MAKIRLYFQRLDRGDRSVLGKVYHPTELMRGTPAALSVQMAILFAVTASNAGGVYSHLHIASCASDVYPTKFIFRHSVDTVTA